MSKNLSEETPGKIVAAQGFGQRQLFRRPAPTMSGSALDWAVANGNGEETISNNTVTDNTYTDCAVAPGSTAFSIGTTSKPINLLLEGWYSFAVQGYWQASGLTGDFAHGIKLGSGTGYFDSWGSFGTLGPGLIMYRSGTMSASIVARFSGLFAGPFHAHIGSGLHLGTCCWHNQGSSQSFNINQFTAFYLGPGLGLPADGSTAIQDLMVSL